MPVSVCDYSKDAVPDGYICGKCNKSGCKLWRDYNSFDFNLMCADCAGEDEGKDVSDLDEKGRRLVKLHPSDTHGERTDQIGWKVPAVPMEEVGGYWGYTSIPALGVAWWHRLPNRV